MKKFSIYLYAIVVSSGLMIEFIINVVIAFLNDWRYIPNFRFKSESFQPLLKMFIPTIFSTGIYQLSLLVDSLIASRLEVGKISILSYSNQIVNIINVAIIGNLLIYSYPKIVKKIKRAVTDSGSEVKRGEGKEGVENLMSIYSAVTGKTMDEIEAEFDGKGYGDFKNAVAEAVVDTIRPIQDKYNDLMKNKDYLKQVYKSGADKANRTAMKTLSKVYRKVGFIEP